MGPTCHSPNLASLPLWQNHPLLIPRTQNHRAKTGLESYMDGIAKFGARYLVLKLWMLNGLSHKVHGFHGPFLFGFAEMCAKGSFVVSFAWITGFGLRSHSVCQNRFGHRWILSFRRRLSRPAWIQVCLINTASKKILDDFFIL